jgi:outer membrane protein TolC
MTKETAKYILFFAALLVCAAVVQTGGHAIAATDNSMPPAVVAPQTGAPDGNGYFTLQRLIDVALERNPEIAAAKWDMEAADARYDGARAAYWPQLGIEGGYLRHLDDQRLIAARYNGELGVFDRDIVRGDVVAKWTLFAGGRQVNDADAAKKFSEAEKKKFIRTRDELVYSVTALYFSIMGQQKVLASLAFSRQALELNHMRVAQLYEAQKAAKVDLLRMDVRLSDLKQTAIREENILAVQKRALFNLMGYEAVPADARLEDKANTPLDSLIDKDRLVEAALQNRPDYQAALKRVDAQSHRVVSARAGHLPSVSLVGTYGVRYAPRPDDAGRNTEATEDIGSAGIVLSVPLFEGGRVAAKVREENALLAAAQDRLKKLALQIRQEVETAALDAMAASERFKATEKSIEQAKESLRIELLKYELGKGSITDVLDAQSALLQAETGNCRSCIDYHISMARLKLATGGSV